MAKVKTKAKEKPVPMVSIVRKGEKIRPSTVARENVVREMLKVFRAPAGLAINYKGIDVLLKRGFSVADLAEMFLISRPSMYRIMDRETTKFLVHPGIVLYINARIDELTASTDV